MQSDEARQALRRQMLADRTELSRKKFDVAAEASRVAQERLLCSPIWKNARSVGLYMPVRGEMSTALLVEAAEAEGKTSLLPRCLDDMAEAKGLMEFHVCRGKESLIAGKFGILEPDPECCPISAFPPDLLIVPAVAMDRHGYRLGYGGGYYDRLLARPAWEHVRTAALVFAMQVVEHIDRRPWDRPLGGLITEEELIWL